MQDKGNPPQGPQGFPAVGTESRKSGPGPRPDGEPGRGTEDAVAGPGLPGSPRLATRDPRLATFLFFLAAAAALAAFAWTGSQFPSDDAVYATVARESLRAGRWSDFTWQGRPFLEKGPLLFWALQASQALLGEGELALRLPGILAALALLAGVARVARIAGLARGASLAAAGFALATNALFLNARRPMTDVPSVALGLWGFALLLEGGPRRATAGGALLGASALAKLTGPVPFLLAWLAVGPGARAATRGETGRPGRDLALALGAAVAVALPWHVAQVASHGRDFLDVYLGYHVFQRATAPLVGPGGPGVYLDWVIDRDPWTGLLVLMLLPMALVLAARGGRAERLGLALSGAALLPLLAVRTALPHYLVAVVPGTALVAGAVAARLLDRAGAPGTRGRSLAAATLAVVVAAVFFAANLRDLAEPDYAPGTRDACAALKAEGAVGRLAGTFDLHDPAVAWYCDAPVAFLAADPGFLAATRHIPMLRDVVRPVSAADLAPLARARALLITRPDRADALAALLRDADAAGDARRFGNRVLVSLRPAAP